MSNVMKI